MDFAQNPMIDMGETAVLERLRILTHLGVVSRVVEFFEFFAFFAKTTPGFYPGRSPGFSQLSGMGRLSGLREMVKPVGILRIFS
jgi:hypothetical protein